MWAQFGKSADHQNKCEHNLVNIQKWDIFGWIPNTVKKFRIFRIKRGHYRNFETVWWFPRCRHHLRRAGLVPRRIDGRKKGLQISFFGWVALIDFDKWSSLCYWRATRKHPLKSGKWNVDKCHGFRKEGSTSDLKLDNATYITVVKNIPKLSIWIIAHKIIESFLWNYESFMAQKFKYFKTWCLLFDDFQTLWLRGRTFNVIKRTWYPQRS